MLASNPSARASLYLSSLCNGLGLSSAVVAVTISALVARSIGWTGELATVPYGIQFLAALVAVPPSARLAARFGRKAAFTFAASCGLLAGIAGFGAVHLQSIALLCASHILIGIHLCNVHFYRYASLEIAPPHLKASAVSLVVFGGIFAAVLGPLLTRNAWFSEVLFESAFLGISVLCGTMIPLIALIRFPPPQTEHQRIHWPNAIRTLFKVPLLLTGAAVSAVGYGAMNLLMIGASIQLDELGHPHTGISVIVQWHVLAMFAPSLFMGKVIEKLGALNVAIGGMALLIVSAIIAAFAAESVSAIRFALILLGLAWNMTFVAGTFLVSANSPTDHRFATQGINDVGISVFSTMGAFFPGPILAWMGWSGANLLALALVSIVAAASLINLRRTRYAD